MSEPVKRYDCNGMECGADYSHMRFVLASDYDALAQRCRELDALLHGTSVSYALRCDELQMMRAERGTLRADNERLRGLIDRIQQIVTHPHESKDALAARVRNILEAAACAHTTGDTPAA